MNQNDPKELLTPEEYEELKLEIFTERKISTEAVADIKLTEEEIQAIRKKTKERRQVFHSKTEKDITEWAFEEGVSYTNSFPLRDDSHKCHLVFTDQTTLLSCEATRAWSIEELEEHSKFCAAFVQVDYP